VFIFRGILTATRDFSFPGVDASVSGTHADGRRVRQFPRPRKSCRTVRTINLRSCVGVDTIGKTVLVHRTCKKAVNWRTEKGHYEDLREL
jgi:hypothetical protein